MWPRRIMPPSTQIPVVEPLLSSYLISHMARGARRQEIPQIPHQTAQQGRGVSHTTPRTEYIGGEREWFTRVRLWWIAASAAAWRDRIRSVVGS